LLAFAELAELPVAFYSAEDLAGVPGDFAPSDFVNRTTGVDNVCERAAALHGVEGRLVIRKTVKDGVTVAAFERSVRAGEESCST
jgi:cobalamin biosynthesis protein CbiG